MAFGGLGFGFAVGVYIGSWGTAGDVAAGGAIWHAIARPMEERDPAERFGGQLRPLPRECPLLVPAIERVRKTRNPWPVRWSHPSAGWSGWLILRHGCPSRSLCMAFASAACRRLLGERGADGEQAGDSSDASPKKKPDQPAPKDATPVAALVEDCVEPVAAEAITSVMVTWAPVGTSVEPVFLGSIGELVFVATGARMYDAAAGEPMVASTSNAAGQAAQAGGGLGVRRVAGGRVAGDVEGAAPGRSRGRAGVRAVALANGQWWSRQNKKELFGEGLAEVYKWTEGRVLALDRAAPARGLGFESYGAGGPVAAEVVARGRPRAPVRLSSSRCRAGTCSPSTICRGRIT